MATPLLDADRYGPWAVVAGGSEGVGARFAHHLAAAGINLVLVARKPGPLEDTAAAVRRIGVEVLTVAADLTVPADIDRLVAATAELEVGLLICNAGANSYGAPVVDGDLERLRQVVDLNVTAPLRLVHHYGAAMKERRRGGILLVGSMSGYLGHAQIAVYAAAKAFSRVFAEGLWLEMRDHDVDVLELVLGMTRTPAMERAGLRMDLPGVPVSEPDAVAVQGLRSLREGPVVVAEGNEHVVAFQNGLDRRKVVLGAHRASQGMLPPD